jgi:hypothetical protein
MHTNTLVHFIFPPEPLPRTEPAKLTFVAQHGSRYATRRICSFPSTIKTAWSDLA